MRSARVTLRVDGAVVGTAAGPISDVFTSATVLVGQGTADAGASTCYWDDVHLWLGSSDLIGNPGFEASLATPPGTAVSVGNWRPGASGSVSRITSPSFAGDYALETTSAGTTAYVIQDVEVTELDTFLFDLRVYRSSSQQAAQLLFDWDRSSARGGDAYVSMSSSATTFSAWGLSGTADPLPTGSWHHIELALQPTERRPRTSVGILTARA